MAGEVHFQANSLSTMLHQWAQFPHPFAPTNGPGLAVPWQWSENSFNSPDQVFRLLARRLDSRGVRDQRTPLEPFRSGNRMKPPLLSA